jgi:hypothetical protein
VRDSSVGIETDYWTGSLGSITDRDKIFLFSISFRPAPIQWVLGSLSLAVKRLMREADNSPQSSTKVKNGGAISPFLLTQG